MVAVPRSDAVRLNNVLSRSRGRWCVTRSRTAHQRRTDGAEEPAASQKLLSPREPIGEREVGDQPHGKDIRVTIRKIARAATRMDVDLLFNDRRRRRR